MQFHLILTTERLQEELCPVDEWELPVHFRYREWLQLVRTQRPRGGVGEGAL